LTVIDLIIQNGKFNGDCINVASGIEIKIKDAVRIFYGLFDAEIDYFFSGKEKIGDPKNWLADIQQIKKMGFSPQFSIETGLKQYIKWLKNCD
jgi:dTDP-glucose 4,6-dehydratase/UDP-glucose 4-epimerase